MLTRRVRISERGYDLLLGIPGYFDVPVIDFFKIIADIAYYKRA